MKNTLKLIGIIAIAVIIGIAITACGGDDDCSHNWEWKVTTPATTEAEGVETKTCSKCGSTDGTRPIPMLKSVAEKYRHTGDWRCWFFGFIEGTITLTINTLTTTEAGFSYSNVYTTVDQGLAGHGPEGTTWAYLFSGEQKIGVVSARPEGGGSIHLGATWLENRGYNISNDIDFSDMQDEHNGTSRPH